VKLVGAMVRRGFATVIETTKRRAFDREERRGQ
jgi:hypothetical protein